MLTFSYAKEIHLCIYVCGRLFFWTGAAVVLGSSVSFFMKVFLPFVSKIYVRFGSQKMRKVQRNSLWKHLKCVSGKIGHWLMLL